VAGAARCLELQQSIAALHEIETNGDSARLGANRV
jgi:hypothetical protein